MRRQIRSPTGAAIESWPEILTLIAPALGNATASLLNGTTARRVKDDVLAILFPATGKVPKGICEGKERMERIASAVSEHFGRPVRIMYEIAAEPKTEGTNNHARPNGQKRYEILNDPAVKTVLTGLDATITGIEEGHRVKLESVHAQRTGGECHPTADEQLYAYTATLNKLIEEFGRLPGIGPKTAERLAFHILKADAPEAMALADAIRNVKTKIQRCKTCCNLSEGDVCQICADTRRDRSLICVVEQPKDVISLEKTGACKWLYHVLGGHIAPLEGIDASDLTIDKLVERVRGGEVKEIVMATNPNLEGDGTSLYHRLVIETSGGEDHAPGARPAHRKHHRVRQRKNPHGRHPRQTGNRVAPDGRNPLKRDARVDEIHVEAMIDSRQQYGSPCSECMKVSR